MELQRPFSFAPKERGSQQKGRSLPGIFYISSTNNFGNAGAQPHTSQLSGVTAEAHGAADRQAFQLLMAHSPLKWFSEASTTLLANGGLMVGSQNSPSNSCTPPSQLHELYIHPRFSHLWVDRLMEVEHQQFWGASAWSMVGILQ